MAISSLYLKIDSKWQFLFLLYCNIIFGCCNGQETTNSVATQGKTLVKTTNIENDDTKIPIQEDIG